MKEINSHKTNTTLSKIPKESGFTVPNEYFENFEDDVISKIKISNFNSELKENKFKTPEGYFDTIEDIVLTKLKAEASLNENDNEIPSDYFETFEDTVITKLRTTKKVYTLKNITKYLAPLAIAASLLLMFILNSNQETVSFDSLALTEIEEFIDQGSIDIDSELLASTFSDIELSTEQQDSFLTDTEVLGYLSDEDLEILMYEN